jgi:hypothetical protein
MRLPQRTGAYFSSTWISVAVFSPTFSVTSFNASRQDSAIVQRHGRVQLRHIHDYIMRMLVQRNLEMRLENVRITRTLSLSIRTGWCVGSSRTGSSLTGGDFAATSRTRPSAVVMRSRMSVSGITTAASRVHSRFHVRG